MVLILFFNLNLLHFKIINMKKINNYVFAFLIIPTAFFSCTDKKVIPEIVAAEQIIDKNWQFETTPIWQDEFNTGSSPDATKWTFETGGSGWGNNELQYYTSGVNSTVSGGNLVIAAKKESLLGREYTSSRMITKGKGDWLYGRFEIKAKLPKGRGTWPAIWMLSSDNAYGNWPSSGEIDIMEHVGYNVNNIHCSIHTSAYNHTRGTQKTTSKFISDAVDAFHIYRIDWTPYAVRGYIDGISYFEFLNNNTGFTAWPFNKPFHLLLNVAVGGDWGGVQGVDNTAFPSAMEVDYVKVYKMIP
jgi:beta-glucanase (GH16 family)